MSNDRYSDRNKPSSKPHLKEVKPDNQDGLSDMATRLQSLEAKLADQPDIDQANVDRLREAITSGEYRIDPDSVAEKMIDMESDRK